MAEPTAGTGTSGSTSTWSVGELSAAIAEHLRAAFPSEVWVRGTIENFPRTPGYHSYFTLADDGDEAAHLSVVLLNTEKTRVNRLLMKAGQRVRMTDGTQVRIRGRLDWYGPRGQLQLRMTSIDPAFTLGQLAAARAELLERLRAEGILDANRAVPMPALPLRLGVITSSGSAAEADLLHELDRSGYAFEIQVADVRVQGTDAPTSVAGAIAWFAGKDIDVVVIVRGGGAATDLAAFDHDLVARAIASSRHPVVTGIGHEVDRAVADEVAHTSAKTPTAAAQHLVAIVADAHRRAETTFSAIHARARHGVQRADEHLDRRVARAATAAASATRLESNRIDHLALRLRQTAPRLLDGAAAHLDGCGRRLGAGALRVVESAGHRLDLMDARASALDPVRALARGWSITRLSDGTVVRSASQAPVGSTLHTTLAEGTVTSTVDHADAEQP